MVGRSQAHIQFCPLPEQGVLPKGTRELGVEGAHRREAESSGAWGHVHSSATARTRGRTDQQGCSGLSLLIGSRGSRGFERVSCHVAKS